MVLHPCVLIQIASGNTHKLKIEKFMDKRPEKDRIKWKVVFVVCNEHFDDFKVTSGTGYCKDHGIPLYKVMIDFEDVEASLDNT